MNPNICRWLICVSITFIILNVDKTGSVISNPQCEGISPECGVDCDDGRGLERVSLHPPRLLLRGGSVGRLPLFLSGPGVARTRLPGLHATNDHDDYSCNYSSHDNTNNVDYHYRKYNEHHPDDDAGYYNHELPSDCSTG